jgi:hypothetical protein
VLSDDVQLVISRQVLQVRGDAVAGDMDERMARQPP